MDTFDPIFMTCSQDRCYFILTSDCQKFSLRNCQLCDVYEIAPNHRECGRGVLITACMHGWLASVNVHCVLTQTGRFKKENTGCQIVLFQAQFQLGVYLKKWGL